MTSSRVHALTTESAFIELDPFRLPACLHPMSTEPLSTIGMAKTLATHVATWLRNLARARSARQQESLQAINHVIAALRMTQAYSRGLKEGHKNHSTEGEIAAQWTRLAHELERLGLMALAKKCDITGRYWADPSQLDEVFLKQAKTDLASVEKLARDLEVKIRLGGGGQKRR
jgi:hypothetical protein